MKKTMKLKNNKNNQEAHRKNSVLLLFCHSLFCTLNEVINAAKELSEVCMVFIQLPCLGCTILYSSIVSEPFHCSDQENKHIITITIQVGKSVSQKLKNLSCPLFHPLCKVAKEDASKIP